MKDEKGHEYSGVWLPAKAIASDDYLTVAVVRYGRDGSCGLAWLPDLFMQALPEPIRKEIVETLRLHAAQLESGDIDLKMRGFASLNQPTNRSRKDS
jgi:hypothetical protein